uniref:glucuronosyltransferase n=1 Tax=Meloidogyne javanica TaxID=6303 RepID=A0A915N7Q7_MELJA
MALSLASQRWVDNVTLFVVEEDHRNRDHNLRGTNKLKIFYYPTYNVDQQTANIYEFSDFSAAHCLNKSTNNLNLEILKSIHGDIKKYFALCLRQYQVCINELRYYPLFPILQLIECKHIVATSNMPLESIYYHYLGLLPNIIENGIPAHPLTILFISHCGINSSLEAAKYGKPLLCAPFIADQFYNSQALASREVAKIVDDRIFENIFQNILDALK